MNTFTAMRHKAIENFGSDLQATVREQSSRTGGALYSGHRWLAAALVLLTLVALPSSSGGQVVPSGGVATWGFNGFGQLGTGDFSRQLTPVSSQAKSDFVQISSTTLADWTLARKSDGTVWAWGRNIEGELADGTFTNRPSPVQVAPNSLTGVVLIAASAGAGAALKSDGTVWTWGDNSFGQGGGGTLGGHFPYASQIVTDINGNPFTGVKTIIGGGGHLLALKNDGTVWAWGFNQFGGVGNFQCTPPPGTCQHVAAPFQVVDSGGNPFTGVVGIAGGGGHSLAVKSDGTVWAWGYNGFGQIGDGTFGDGVNFGNTDNDKHTPVQVTGVANAVAVAGGENWSMALLNDGTLRTWGFNDMGQLGDGTGAPRPVAAPVLSAGPGSAPLFNVKAIAAASLHALALLNDGTLKAWGQNDDGEGGNGTTTNPEPTPLPVLQLANVIAIAAGHSHSVALVPPTPPKVDLAITKAGNPDEVSIGQNITYTLSVTNNGPDAATNVTLIDSLPSSVTFVFAGSNQGSCSGTSVITCTLGMLANGSSATITIIVQATGDITNPGHQTITNITNTASVSATENDPNATNNQASVVTAVLSTNANCNLVQGNLQEQQVSPPPGLVTTGTFMGSVISGRFDFSLAQSSSTGDPTIPSIQHFVGHSTVTTRGGVINFTEAGAIDTIGLGRLGSVMTVTGGTGDWEDATGQFVRSGFYSLLGGSGQSTVRGQVCVPGVVPPPQPPPPPRGR
jgi:uncharacterized repeat protein (TIGR01451 family)